MTQIIDDEFLNLSAKIVYLNKRFLEYLKNELEDNDIHGISAIQALIIKNIGTDKRNVWKTTNCGYYPIGTNLSYNINILIESGFVEKNQDRNDTRNAIISLTAKGLRILDIINGAIMSQENALFEVGISDKDLRATNKILDKLEKFLRL